MNDVPEAVIEAAIDAAELSPDEANAVAHDMLEAAYPLIAAEVLAAARKRVEAERKILAENDPVYNGGIDAALAALGQDTGETATLKHSKDKIESRTGLPDHLKRDHSCHQHCPCQMVTVTLSREEIAGLADCLDWHGTTEESERLVDKLRAALEGDQ